MYIKKNVRDGPTQKQKSRGNEKRLGGMGTNSHGSSCGLLYGDNLREERPGVLNGFHLLLTHRSENSPPAMAGTCGGAFLGPKACVNGPEQ